jgi:hypothetical protein
MAKGVSKKKKVGESLLKNAFPLQFRIDQQRHRQGERTKTERKGGTKRARKRHVKLAFCFQKKKKKKTQGGSDRPTHCASEKDRRTDLFEELGGGQKAQKALVCSFQRTGEAEQWKKPRCPWTWMVPKKTLAKLQDRFREGKHAHM